MRSKRRRSRNDRAFFAVVLLAVVVFFGCTAFVFPAITFFGGAAGFLALAGAALTLATDFFTLVAAGALALGTAAGLEVVGRVVLLLVDALDFVVVALSAAGFAVLLLVGGLAGALVFTAGFALELGLFYHRKMRERQGHRSDR